MDTTSALRNAFLDDHRAMMRGLAKIKSAVEAGRDTHALELAHEVDLVAGPHIAFEETELYPRMQPMLGADNVHRLYREHAAGRRVFTALLDHEPDEPLGAEERRQILDWLREMLDHAASCGTLLSHLERLPAEDREAMAARLEALRAEGVRWSQSPRAAAARA